MFQTTNQGYCWDIVIKINTIPNITGKYYPNITKRIGFIIFSTWDSIGLIIILYYWTYPPVSSNVAIAWKPPMKMEVSMENHLHRGFLIAIFDYRRVWMVDTPIGDELYEIIWDPKNNQPVRVWLALVSYIVRFGRPSTSTRKSHVQSTTGTQSVDAYRR